MWVVLTDELPQRRCLIVQYKTHIAGIIGWLFRIKNVIGIIPKINSYKYKNEPLVTCFNASLGKFPKRKIAMEDIFENT